MDSFTIFTFSIAGILLVFIIYEIVFSDRSSSGMSGKKIVWRLGPRRRTEIISNKGLGAIQAHRELGGTLINGDFVFVIAREFLDDDILFEVVRENLKRGIYYFYILDRMHVDRFRRLLERLYSEIQDHRLVNEGVTVMFVRQELVLNNFVILAYGTERQSVLSSMIFDERAFGWLRQDSSRAEFIVSRIKTLVANLALSQVEALGPNSLNYVHSDDQIMDFQQLGHKLVEKGMDDPETAAYNLANALKNTKMPTGVQSKVILLQDRVPNVRRSGQ